MSAVDLRLGDCRQLLRELDDASVDAIVTDPPYGLGFMGKSWDTPGEMLGHVHKWGPSGAPLPSGTYTRGYTNHDSHAFQAWCAEWAAECLRVLKPGGHLVAFGGTRTYHRMACAVEDAGFELRDSLLAWLYGSGFPKGQNVARAITATERHGGSNSVARRRARLGADAPASGRTGNEDGLTGGGKVSHLGDSATRHVPVELTEAAQQWDGWNTALKPAHEPIVLARKPLSGTVARNVLEHGTGALHVDACRVGVGQSVPGGGGGPRSGHANAPGEHHALMGASVPEEGGRLSHTAGRWPANVLLCHLPECGPDGDPQPCVPGCPVAELDAQSGVTTRNVRRSTGGVMFGHRASGSMDGGSIVDTTTRGLADTGGTSRFFPQFRYQAKASTSERPKIDGRGWPTVKPLALMEWLVRLVTPSGGLVLDPFAGTGTTLQAARRWGFRSLGFEADLFAYDLACVRLGLPREVA